MSNGKVLTDELLPIPDGYEVVKAKAPLEPTDRFLHEGKWVSATESFIEMATAMTGKSVYHGNIPVIRKIKKEGI